MHSFNRKAVLIAVFLMLLAAVFPASAGRLQNAITNVTTVGCTIIIDFEMPVVEVARLDTKVFARPAAGSLIPISTVYVIIIDDGVNIASIPVTGQAGSPQQVIYQVDRYYELEDIDIEISENSDGVGNVYGFRYEYFVPDSVYDSCQGEEIPTVATPACPYPLSNVTLGQGRVIFPTEVFWGPSFDALTDVVLPVGTSWWILEARDGFYKLFVACQAQYVWVPAESLGANFDVVWGGRPLPPAGDTE